MWFGFYVTDFIGALDKTFDGDFGEGFVGELADGGELRAHHRVRIG